MFSNRNRSPVSCCRARSLLNPSTTPACLLMQLLDIYWRGEQSVSYIDVNELTLKSRCVSRRRQSISVLDKRGVRRCRYSTSYKCYCLTGEGRDCVEIHLLIARYYWILAHKAAPFIFSLSFIDCNSVNVRLNFSFWSFMAKKTHFKKSFWVFVNL